LDVKYAILAENGEARDLKWHVLEYFKPQIFGTKSVFNFINIFFIAIYDAER